MKIGVKITLLAVIVIFAVALGLLIAKLQEYEYPVPKHTYQFSVVVVVSGDFSLDISPKNADGEPELVLIRGEKKKFSITAVPSGGFDVPILIQVIGLPAGSYTITPNPMPYNGTCELEIDSSVLKSNTVYVCQIEALAYAGVF